MVNEMDEIKTEEIKQEVKSNITMEQFLEKIKQFGYEITDDSKNNRWTAKKGKNVMFYLHKRRYGFAFQTLKDKAWKTEKIKTEEEMNKKIEELQSTVQ
jgi:hypothetical protein